MMRAAPPSEPTTSCVTETDEAIIDGIKTRYIAVHYSHNGETLGEYAARLWRQWQQSCGIPPDRPKQ